MVLSTQPEKRKRKKKTHACWYSVSETEISFSLNFFPVTFFHYYCNYSSVVQKTISGYNARQCFSQGSEHPGKEDCCRIGRFSFYSNTALPQLIPFVLEAWGRPEQVTEATDLLYLHTVILMKSSVQSTLYSGWHLKQWPLIINRSIKINFRAQLLITAASSLFISFVQWKWRKREVVQLHEYSCWPLRPWLYSSCL